MLPSYPTVKDAMEIHYLKCVQLRTGSRGRPPKTLPPGVKVRLKNKGSQKSKPGRKRPKYEAPHREHPDTSQTLDEQDIHANHVEAQNAALRRQCFSTTNKYLRQI